jgi:S1-C subfamily serine protease
VAAIAGAGAVAAIAVIALFAAGVFSGGDDTLSPTEVADSAEPSTVQVIGVDADGKPVWYGSGWVYDASRGLVVTSATSIGQTTDWVVRLGEEKQDRAVSLVAVSPCQDLAVLRVEETTGMETMPLRSEQALERGEGVVALGYPVAQITPSGRLVANEGVVSVPSGVTNQAGLPRLEGVILTDLSLNPGNEGGPLLDLEAQLAGMNVRFREGGVGAQGQSYAIGVERIEELVPDLVDGRSTGWTGMQFDYGLDETTLADLGLPNVAGLVVTRAVPGTAAAEAGFGSTPVVVTAIDDQALDGTLASYCAATGERTSEDSATFTFIVSGETEQRSLELRFD